MLRIGTCSWKYDSWRGIIYPDKNDINYLEEYSKHFKTVEVDQWFWSLFGNNITLPNIEDVENYKNSVPADFIFTIKVPNSITLTHHYNKNKSEPLIPNPHFLSNNLFEEFLKKLKPLENQIGSLMFQFEYLNKQKMPSLKEFQNRLYDFFQKIPQSAPPISIEIRNPNYLYESYFKFLKQLKISHVFLEGYYMPSIIEVYKKNKINITGTTVIRLHGPDRKGMEKVSSKNWDKIYIDRDNDIKIIVKMIRDLQSKNVDIYLNINNHYEGSAPLTIEKIKKYLS